MWWLVTLLILAAVAFFVVKSMKSNTQLQQSEHELQQQARLDGSAASQSAPSTQAVAQPVAESADTATAGASDNKDSVASTATMAAGGAVAAAAMTAGSAASTGINTGDALSDVREMIKILNLDAPDAGRLQISREQMTALRKGEQTGLPDGAALDDVAARLRRMLA